MKEDDFLRGFDYDELVSFLIRLRYTESQEFAIIRQQDVKPDEYREYYEFCESCKKQAKQTLA